MGITLIENAITTVIQISKHNLEVRFDNNQPHIKNNIIHLPPIAPISKIPESSALTMLGYAAHEAAHKAWTIYPPSPNTLTNAESIPGPSKMPAATKRGLYFSIWNILEDLYIEKTLTDKYPGTFTYLDPIRTTITEDVAANAKDPEQTTIAAIHNSILAMANSLSMWSCTEMAYETWHRNAQRVPGLLPILQRAYKTISITQDENRNLIAFPLFREILNLLKNIEDSSKQPPKNPPPENQDDATSPEEQDDAPEEKENSEIYDGNSGEDSEDESPGDQKTEDECERKDAGENEGTDRSEDENEEPGKAKEDGKDTDESPGTAPEDDTDETPQSDQSDTNCNDKQQPVEDLNTSPDAPDTNEDAKTDSAEQTPEDSGNTGEQNTTESEETNTDAQQDSSETKPENTDLADDETQAGTPETEKSSAGGGYLTPQEEPKPDTDAPDAPEDLHDNTQPDQDDEPSDNAKDTSRDEKTEDDINAEKENTTESDLQTHNDDPPEAKEENVPCADIHDLENFLPPEPLHELTKKAAKDLIQKLPPRQKEKAHTQTQSVNKALISAKTIDASSPLYNATISALNIKPTRLPETYHGQENTFRNLIRLLMSQKEEKTRRRVRYGKLDTRNCMDIAVGTGNIYTHTQHRRRVNAAITILVDCSTSTLDDGILSTALFAAKSLGHLSAANRNIRTAIYGYTSIASPEPRQALLPKTRPNNRFSLSSLIYLMKGFSQGVEAIDKSYENMTHNILAGGTPTGTALLRVIPDLLAQPENLKILITITDGEANDHSIAKTALKICHESNINTVVIEIGEDLETHMSYGNTYKAKDANEIPLRLEEAIMKFMQPPLQF